jgi:hypothetical protein
MSVLREEEMEQNVNSLPEAKAIPRFTLIRYF